MGGRQLHLVSILVSGGQPDAFTIMVEPEGMSYEFPPEERVLLTFRGAGAMKFELGYFPGGLSLWRPGDTEVWAASTNNPEPQQIAVWSDIPAPWLDSRAPKMDMPVAEWDHLHLPLRDR
jgi:hypothetical protein